MSGKRKNSCCNVKFNEKSKLGKKWNHLQPIRELSKVSIKKQKRK